MKIGLLGYGYWGEYVARAIARVGELAVIADPNPARQMEAQTAWGAWGTRVASEPHVAFEECDAVWIATPTVDHDRLVWDALTHGVHVLCEKPFVTTRTAAEMLTGLAAEHDLALMVGHLSLYTGAHHRAKADADQRAKAEWPAADTVVTRRNTAPSLSDGSVLFGIGPHDVAALVDLCGSPVSVSCEGTVHRVEAAMVFADESVASLELDWLAERRERSFKRGIVECATAENIIEPLLLEAQSFVALCGPAAGDERAAKRCEALLVTETLERLERARVRLAVSA